MFERLADIERRYEELERLVSDPAVIGNRREFAKLARERAQLDETVACRRERQRVAREGAEHRELAHGKDEELRELARGELPALEERLEELDATLKRLLVPRDPNDERNPVLEIRAGTGGDGASVFAAELFRMYSRYAERHGWRVEVLSSSPTGLGGFKEVIALVQGKGAFSRLKFEGGVHRVQRVPVTETQGRIHTSAVTVAVLPEAEDVEVELADKDLRIDVYRSSGPGGQSVNTTDSAVRVTHLPTGLVVTCQDEKSQHKNKAKALKILRARLLERARSEQQSEIAANRKAMVGSGDRSEKIRTYNFPQSRVTDHRVNVTLHTLDRVLVGEREFWSLLLTVDRRVLVPRPETELVVETALRLAPAARRILDVGTGSGAIAAALARELPAARVWASDIDADALAVARANLARHAPGVALVCGDLLAPFRAAAFDLVAANPPYVTDGELGGPAPEVRDHEPRVALAAGPDGLAALGRLVAEAPRVLAPGGWLVVEVGAGQAPAVRRLAEAGERRQADRRGLGASEERSARSARAPDGPPAELDTGRYVRVEVVRDHAGIERVLALKLGGGGWTRS